MSILTMSVLNMPMLKLPRCKEIYPVLLKKLVSSLLLLATLALLPSAAVAAPDNYEVAVKLKSSDNDSLGVMFRYQDSDNYYRFYINSQNDRRRLDKTVNGVTTTLANDTHTYAKNVVYALVIRAQGQQLSVEFDGEAIMAVEDASLSSGGVALYTFANASSYFDDLTVVNLNNDELLLQQDFSSSAFLEDISIVDEGNKSGPSAWSFSGGWLRQSSNIYRSSDSPRSRGSYALINATLDSSAYSSVAITPQESFTVNSVASGQQWQPSVASNDAGLYAIAWEDDGLGNDNVLYSLYQADGSALVQDRQINSVTAGSHHAPQLVVHQDGRVTAVWQEDADGNGYYNIRARSFDAAGGEIRPEFSVNSVGTGQQLNPSITVNSAGQFAVAWEDDALGNGNIMYRLFDDQAQAISDDRYINHKLTGTHLQPRLLLKNDLAVLAVWQDDADGNNYYNITARGFNPDGSELFTAFRANAIGTGHQYRPAVAELVDGGFVVAYEDDWDRNGIYDIRMRGFNADGSERFADRQLNFTSPIDQLDVELVSLTGGGYAAVWTQASADGSNVVARFFDHQGLAQTNDAPWPLINTAVQMQASVVATAADSLLLSWADDLDGNGYYQVKARRQLYYPDRDGDGIGDAMDAFPDQAAEWLDTDGDGLGNNADTDDDNDAMSDAWELAHGLDPLLSDAAADADNDGANNLQEYGDGSDPQSDLSCIYSGCRPAVAFFSASLAELELGQSVDLGWQVVNADDVSISELGSGLALADSAALSPQKTTKYVLTASSAQGSASRELDVKVFKAVSEASYDASGQRVSLSRDGQTSVFVYGPSGELLAELDQSGQPLREHVYLQGELLAQVRQPNTPQQQTLYIHNDHLATPKLVTDSNRQPVWSIDTTPFGEVVNETAQVDQPVRFPGQYSDGESGLYYNYFRDYDPSLGRYIESDPIGLAGGLNTYGYVVNNPLRYIDFLGLDATDWNNTSGGRSVMDGPTNGNWGGKCWGGGQYSCGGEGNGDAPPVDSADVCAMEHDLCWGECESDSECKEGDEGEQSCKDTCDAEFKQCLLNIDTTDPKKWPNPPPPGTESDSKDWQHGGIYLGGKNFFRK